MNKIQKINVLAYVLNKYLNKIFLLKKTNIKSQEKNLLFFYLGSLGDSVYNIDLFNALQTFFAKQKGYVIYFIGIIGIKDFLQKYTDLNFKFVEFELTCFNINIEAYKNLYMLLHDIYFDKVICLQRDLLLQSIILTLQYDEVILIEDSSSRKKGLLHNIYKSLLYTNEYEFDKELNWRERKQFFADVLGVKNYRTKMPKINNVIEDKDIKPSIYKDYIAFAPTAQTFDRNVPLKLSIEIIEYLLEKYNVCIILLGVKKDINYFESIMQQFNNSRKLISFVGKTNVEEFINVLSNSKLIISADSSSAHLGPALAVKTLVISGYWDKDIVFPYQYYFNEEKYSYSIKSNKKYSCAGCNIYGYRGALNLECKNNICAKKAFKCLSDVEEMDIFKIIDGILLGNI